MIIIEGVIGIKKMPFVKQSGTKDCALAAVLMIVKYYNGYIRTSKLEEMLNITRNGTTAYHIVKTLKQLGFNAYGIKENKIKETNIPFIANVIINSSYKHFIVVYKVTKKYILIADPASKIKKTSLEEFYKIWTGINIEMYPERKIINEKPKKIKKIYSSLWPSKKQIIVIGIYSLIITLLAISSSFLFQILIENIKHNLKNIIIFFLILLVLKNIINYLRGKYLIKFANNIDSWLTKKIFKQIILLPYRYYHNHTTGEIISKLNDLSIIREIISKIILTIFIDFPLTIFSGILLLSINKCLFLIAIIILLLYIITIFYYHKKINNYIEINLDNKAQVYSFMTEGISGFETIKGINIEDKIINIFNKKYDNYINKQEKLNHLLNRQNLLKNYINELGAFSVIVIGIMLVKNGYMSLGILITYNILMNLFLEPVKNIIDLEVDIKQANNSLNKVLDLIQDEKIKNKKLKGDIIIKNYSFSFDDINNVLKNINVKIKKQNKVLITGKSGSGKSTLLKIIKGYYKNNNTNVIYISQKEILFTGTINYNLTLKDNNDLKNIKKICHIKDITKISELGENMLLEENGFNISDGQRQRIALARSLHSFDVLLIDEGLNALDVNLERKILKKLFKHYKNKTIIQVSHRLDNLDLFDQYIKMENGKIILDTSLKGKEK